MTAENEPQPAADHAPQSEDKWGIGDPTKATSWGPVLMGFADKPRRFELLYGEGKHSYSDNRLYARSEHGTIFDFDGHRILIDVVVRSKNYLKESELSGDEIRKGGSCEIKADGETVYEFFFRDPQAALLKAHHLIGLLSEHSSHWLVKEEREKLIGRKIWYERTPAVIESLIVDQGCVILKPDGVAEFPPSVWDEDPDPEDRRSIKSGKDAVGSLLLGLYDAAGVLQHVGVASSFATAMRKQLATELAPLRKNAMDGHPWREWASAAAESSRMPGAQSRWSAGKDLSWEPLRIERVCEVKYDHMQGDRFRHAAFFLRWRPDKRPQDCRYDQLEVTKPYELERIFSSGSSGS